MRILLVEAVDETKRLALIDLLIEEQAKERLEKQVAADRAAITVSVYRGVDLRRLPSPHGRLSRALGLRLDLKFGTSMAFT